jgi:hypothetical protein
MTYLEMCGRAWRRNDRRRDGVPLGVTVFVDVSYWHEADVPRCPT